MTEPSQPPTPAKTTARRAFSGAARGARPGDCGCRCRHRAAVDTDPPFSSHTKIAALDYVPADVAQAEIRNRAATEQRLGIDDIESGASAPEIDKYVQVANSSRWVANEYTPYLPAMISAGHGLHGARRRLVGDRPCRVRRRRLL